MPIFRINLKNPDKKIINHAVQVLRGGGVIVYPTDTAYALGGVFNNQEVEKKILKIKKRRDTKFTIIASSLSQARRFFKLNSAQIKLAKKYWPGPLSLVVSPRLAVRVPACLVAQKLAAGVGTPLIATSANISGEATPYEVSKAVSADLVLDAGKLPKRKTSTVVKVENEKVRVLRAGAVKVK